MATHDEKWWRNPAVIVPSAVAIAAAILGAVIPLVFFDCDEPLPTVSAVNPSRATSGKEINVSGKNLDLVSEVYLRTGFEPPIRVSHASINDSSLILTVHSGVNPSQYVIELKTARSDELMSTGAAITVDPLADTIPSPPLAPTPIATPAQSSAPTPAQLLAPTPTPTPAQPRALTVTSAPAQPLAPTPSPIPHSINGFYTGKTRSSVTGDQARIEINITAEDCRSEDSCSVVGSISLFQTFKWSSPFEGGLTEKSLSFSVVHTDSPPVVAPETLYSGRMDLEMGTIDGEYITTDSSGNFIDTGTWSVSR